jgi:hypothetical protein
MHIHENPAAKASKRRGTGNFLTKVYLEANKAAGD